MSAVDKLRAVEAICDARGALRPRLARALAAFAAEYYQRGLGEVALPALPQALRDASRWARLFAPAERYRRCRPAAPRLPDALPVRANALRRLAEALAAQRTLAAADARALHREGERDAGRVATKGWVVAATKGTTPRAELPRALTDDALPPPGLTPEQREAVDAIDRRARLRAFPLARRDGQRQDRGLSARARGLLARGRTRRRSARPRDRSDAAARAPRSARASRGRVAMLHSGLAEGERVRSWRARARGEARARRSARGSAVFAPLPALGADHRRRGARPVVQAAGRLPLFRPRSRGLRAQRSASVPVVLGSATPSLESCANARQGRYRSSRCRGGSVGGRAELGSSILKRAREPPGVVDAARRRDGEPWRPASRCCCS